MQVWRWYFSMAVLLCLSASIAAQRSAGGGEQKPTTIVGCLVQGLPQQGAAEMAAYAQDLFVRTPTVKIPTGTTIVVGKSGAADAAASAGTPAADSFYRVAGLTHEELRPHLGHRVELQGRLTDNTPGIELSRATTTQDKDGRATTTVETRVAIAGVLHATSIKMVSTSCEK